MKNKIEFLFMFILVILSAYLLGGIVSGTLSLVFIIIFISAVVFTRITKRNIEIRTIFPEEDVMREEFIEVKVEIKNKSILPTSIIEIEFIKDDIFIFDDTSIFKFNIESKKSKIITIKYNEFIRGKGLIGIKSIKVKDYFCISSINIDSKKYIKEITVLPVMFPIDLNSEIVKKLLCSYNFENERCYINSNNMEREPGYDFRKYFPGDNLNRINWKSFLKNGEVLVRKDENIIRSNSTVIIINPCININNKDRSIIENKMLKSALSLAFVLLSKNVEVEIYIYENDIWDTYKIISIESLLRLQIKFVEYKFIYKSKDIDIKTSLEPSFNNKNVVFITESIESIDCISKLQGVEVEVLIVRSNYAEVRDNGNFKENLWMLVENNEIHNLS